VRAWAGARGHHPRARFGNALDGLAEALSAGAAGNRATLARGGRAFAVNLTCALMLARYRQHESSLTRAAFLSARNDVAANVAIVGAGLVTAYIRSAWPDLIVGLGIAVMNADSAREVFSAAREEHRAALP
jgi:Co/Zn/Cd efflux system component